MSIVGQPQETHTVISSWEILDSPVPFRQPRVLSHTHQSPYYSTSDKLDEPVPQQVTPNAVSSQQSDTNFAEQDSHRERVIDGYTNTPDNHRERVIDGYTNTPDNHRERVIDGYTNTPELTGVVSPHESDSVDRESDVHEVDANITTDDPPSAVNLVTQDNYREPQPCISGTAIYVSTHPRQADDIADTIVTEFEQHARQSQSSHRREYQENIAQRIHSDTIPEFSELDVQSHQSEVSQYPANQNTTLQYRNDSVESSEINQQLDEWSRDNTDTYRISQVPNDVREPSELSQFPVARGYSEVRVMSVSSAVNVNSEVHSTVSNLEHESEPDAQQNNERIHPNCGRVDSSSSLSRQRRRENVNPRHVTEEQTNIRDSPVNLASHSTSSNHDMSTNNQTNQGETISQVDHQQPSTPSRNATLQVSSRSIPDGGDFSPVRFGVEQGISPTGPNVASPIYHPPPTIVQNGISQSDLLELMSKGLSNFTTEMAILVIDKLKPEYETIAKQVGKEVKETTVSELKDLREKLRETEYKLESMSDERDLLKTQNIKERDLMKREFEKDRLKRVKEFEEKNELIDKLQAENDKLQSLLKDKDKYLKRSDSKVKSEEAKRVKSEEESEKRLKDLQKELDKAKGEILVLKSKKRVQTTSAAKNRKETLLGKLNSNHGMYPRHFNGHVPYDEGDDG